MQNISKEKSSAQKPRVHLQFLDGMRGIAALYVVLHHASMMIMDMMNASSPSGSGSLFRKIYDQFHFFALNHGHYAVVCFIALSGFCLALPLTRSGLANFNLKTFVTRRAKRILPPYYVVLFISIGIIALIPGMNSSENPSASLHLPALTWNAIGSHLLMVHNLFPSVSGKINGPLWSVALEWQIYFIFALLLVPMWKKWNLTSAVIVALILGIAPRYLIPEDSFFRITSPWMLGAFAFGMAAAAICFDDALEKSKIRNKTPWLPISTVLGLALLGLFLLQRKRFAEIALLKPFMLDANGIQYVADLLVAIWFCALIIGGTLRLQAHSTSGQPLPFSVRLFSQGWAQSLGTFSYSLYLIHMPILGLVVKYAFQFINNGEAAGAASFILAPLASIAAAYLLYLGVERYCLNTKVPVKPSGEPTPPASIISTAK